MTKIYIGKLKSEGNHSIYAGEKLWLSKHTWDCGWYWSLGYIGNKDLHAHFKVFLQDTKCASEIFEEQMFTDNEWWVIRDLFAQAYALKKAAEIYKYGGHQTSKRGVTDIIKSEDKADEINADLKAVIDKVWDFMNECIKNQSVLKEKIELIEKKNRKLEEKIAKTSEDKELLMNELESQKTSLSALRGELIE